MATKAIIPTEPRAAIAVEGAPTGSAPPSDHDAAIAVEGAPVHLVQPIGRAERPLTWREALTSNWGLVLIYTSLLTFAEMLVTYVRPEIGAVVHVFIMVSLLVHSAVIDGAPISNLLLALVIAPLIRLLSLSMPLFEFDLVYWYLIISTPLFISAYSVARQLGYSWRRVGFNFNKPLLQIAAILFGFAFGITEFAILRPNPLVPVFSPEGFALAAFSLLIGTGLMEELVFRGILQQEAERTLGGGGSILFAAVIFTVLHIGWNNLLDLAFVFTAGAFWGYIFYRSRSIVGITISHAITNILLFVVLPLITQGV
jgi:membrane protease YdiL (CAAX protease family)